MGAIRARRTAVSSRSSCRARRPYVENVGFYNPTRDPAEVRLDMERVNYWIARGAQPTDTVRQLIRQQSRAQAAAAAEPQPTA